MLHGFRAQFGTAGMIIAIIALVAALAGGAYAASGGLTGKQKKEVKKIAKSFQGSGPAGAQGAPGTAGSAGAKGDPGAAGKDGTSVTGVAATPGECPAGGIKYTSASGTNTVCNGKNGTTGFTETLPSGKTETGVWTAGIISDSEQYPGNGNAVLVSLSFNIPLEGPLDYPHVHFIQPDGKEHRTKIGAGGETAEEIEVPSCPGTVTEPIAEPGHLCVYAKSLSELTAKNFYSETEAFAPFATVYNPTLNTEGGAGAAASGAMLKLYATGGSNAEGRGTWAVTAE